MNYELLSSLYYKGKEEYEKEYNDRFNSIASKRLNISIEENQCFYILTEEVVNKLYNVMVLNQKLDKLTSEIPRIALQRYIKKCLIGEIVLTNEIEGVVSTRKDINEILSKILFEFPIAKINFMCPKWVNVLEDDNEIKNAVLELSRNILMVLNKIKDINSLPNTKENPYIKSITINNVNLSDGEITITYAIYDKYYYMTLSEMTNTQINNELELVSFVKELAEKKDKFEKVNYAIDEVKTKGYGIVVPTKDEITLENPQLIRSGGKFGVKIKANAPSMHFVKANIVTEISPIIGSEEQANDLIDYINGQKTDENANIWDTNIFGKTIEQIVKDGIVAKISGMSDETQGRMQNTIEKITNDQSKGVICILL